MKTAHSSPCGVARRGPGLGAVRRRLGKLNKAADQADKVKDFHISEQDEREIGEAGQRCRFANTFGVYQDAAVTKYVTLVGTVLAQASTRPDLNWEFIVLDTDGVNAFAAPGGIIHITRGALGLIKTEAELAGVLGHEITHVTEKHTIGSIEKSNMMGAGADQVSKGGLAQDAIARIVEQTYTSVLNNKFDRNEELRGRPPRRGPGQQGRLRPERPEHAADQDRGAQQGSAGAERPVRVASAAVGPHREDRPDDHRPEAHGHGDGRGRATPAPSPSTPSRSRKSPVIADGSRGLAGGSGSTDKKEEEKKDEQGREEEGGLFGASWLEQGQRDESSPDGCVGGRPRRRPGSRRGGRPNKNKLAVTVTAGRSRGLQEGHRLDQRTLALLHASPHPTPDHERRGPGRDARHDQPHPQRARQAQAPALRLSVRRATSSSTSCCSCGRRSCRRISTTQLRSFEQLALAAALINLLVVGLINPLRSDRVPDAFPGHPPGRDRHRPRAHRRDLRLRGQAADDVGGRRGGRRLRAAGHAGQRLRRPGDPEREAVPRRRTGSGSAISRGASPRSPGAPPSCAPSPATSSSFRTTSSAKEAITNYSEPLAPTRLEVEVGASYLRPPSEVKRAIAKRWRSPARAARRRPPDALLRRLRRLGDQLPRPVLDRRLRARRGRRATRCGRRSTTPSARHGIEIPWPIQVEYEREWPEPDEVTKLRRAGSGPARGVDLFARALDEQRHEIARATTMADLRERRGDRAAGRAGRLDVRGVLRARRRGARAGAPEVAAIRCRAATSARCRC